MLQGTATLAPLAALGKPIPAESAIAEREAVSTNSEAGFSIEDDVIGEQVRQTQSLREG